jgi:hypothetical protein
VASRAREGGKDFAWGAFAVPIEGIIERGGRPLAIACAIRLAYSSVGENFGWARLIEVPPRIICNDSPELVSFLSELAISTHKIRALGVGQVEKELFGLAVSCNSARALLTIWSLGYAYRVRSM